ncbi:MAG: hypothetical protein P1R58_08460 [bacterium]|nr:hypothetical protein [bacterium]
MAQSFKQMNCYILAGGKKNQDRDFSSQGELTRLETGYRRYAAVFDKVKLVIKEDQAKEHYLNYPHVCDASDHRNPVIGLQAALDDTGADAVFIGSTELVDFPLELPVNLVKNYNGEPFLGYHIPDMDENAQPLFAIYSRELLNEELTDSDGKLDMHQLLTSGGKLLPLPKGVDAACISG